MKYVIAVAFAFLMGTASFGQLQLSRMSIDDSAVHTVPRYSWNVPLVKEFTLMESPALHVGIGVGGFIRNQGVIYDLGADRYKHRVITAGPVVQVPLVIAQKVFLMVGYGLNYPIHYKEKIFRDRLRKNKEIVVSEWLSKRTTQWYHHFLVKVGMANGVSVTAEVFPQNFFNPDYAVTDGGITTYPYKGYMAQLANISLDIHFKRPGKKEGADYEDE